MFLASRNSNRFRWHEAHLFPAHRTFVHSDRSTVAAQNYDCASDGFDLRVFGLLCFVGLLKLCDAFLGLVSHPYSCILDQLLVLWIEGDRRGVFGVAASVR